MIVCGKHQDRLEFIENVSISLVSVFEPKNKKIKEVMKSMQELAKGG